MKIDYFKIRSGFKNIKNLNIDFDERQLLTVLVGRNGSGKSNVIEALVRVFKALDLKENAPFSYQLKYCLGEDDKVWVDVNASPDYGNTPIQQHKIKVAEVSKGEVQLRWKKISFSKVVRSKDGKSNYLPNHLFAYYSGPSDRLEHIFRQHRTNFYTQLLHSEVDIDDEVRPLFYAKPYHSQFVLLAFFLSQQSDVGRLFLKEQLGIEEFCSAHFVFRKPGWAKVKDEKDIFWGAKGVVRQFLSRLYPNTFGAIKTHREETKTLTGKGVSNEFLHLYLPDLLALKSVAKGLEPKNFFKMLESTLLSELVDSVHVKVRMSLSGSIVSFNELSEGEQQLLTVFGLLQFTSESDSLFLLDEPDTHLNPAWAAKYHAFLKRFIPNSKRSHIIMATHHPLAIAELEKEQIQVFQRTSDGLSKVDKPLESPIGMGVNGILTSDMFGMMTTLDRGTRDVIESRRQILEKSELTKQDKLNLEQLNSSLEQLGYGYIHPDEDYRQFLIARRRALQEMEKNDVDTIEVRLRLIENILKDKGLST